MNASKMNVIMTTMLSMLATAMQSSASVAGANYAIITNFGGNVLAVFTGRTQANARNLSPEDKDNHRITVQWSPTKGLRELLCTIYTAQQDLMTNRGGYARIEWVESKVDDLLASLKGADTGYHLWSHIVKQNGLGAVRIEANARSGRYEAMNTIAMGQEAWAKQLDLATIALDKFVKAGNPTKAWKGKTLGDMIASIGDASQFGTEAWVSFQRGAQIDHGDVIDFNDL